MSLLLGLQVLLFVCGLAYFFIRLCGNSDKARVRLKEGLLIFLVVSFIHVVILAFIARVIGRFILQLWRDE